MATIQSKPATKQSREGWERVYGKKKVISIKFEGGSIKKQIVGAITNCLKEQKCFLKRKKFDPRYDPIAK